MSLSTGTDFSEGCLLPALQFSLLMPAVGQQDIEEVSSVQEQRKIGQNQRS